MKPPCDTAREKANDKEGELLIVASLRVWRGLAGRNDLRKPLTTSWSTKDPPFIEKHIKT